MYFDVLESESAHGGVDVAIDVRLLDVGLVGPNEQELPHRYGDREAELEDQEGDSDAQ